jgi:hypothetical protein
LRFTAALCSAYCSAPICAIVANSNDSIVPRFLNYIVAIFLIISGIIGLGFVR